MYLNLTRRRIALYTLQAYDIYQCRYIIIYYKIEINLKLVIQKCEFRGYFYQILNLLKTFTSQHMSTVRHFKTAPPVGADLSYKFIAYGDMGIDPPARSTAKYALKDVQDGYEFIFHNGDNSYARGQVSQRHLFH